jgi:hypothetical protein
MKLIKITGLLWVSYKKTTKKCGGRIHYYLMCVEDARAVSKGFVEYQQALFLVLKLRASV